MAAEWFAMTDSSGDFLEQDNQALLNVVEDTHLKVMAILSNLKNDTWYPESVENLLFGKPEKRKIFIQKLVRQLENYPLHGLIID